MEKIPTEELLNIYGGGKKGIFGVIGIALAVIGTIIAGIVDGYLRPLPCNK